MDHEVGPWKRAFFHGPTSMVQFLKRPTAKAYGPLARCKTNVKEEESPCTKNECVGFFKVFMGIRENKVGVS